MELEATRFLCDCHREQMRQSPDHAIKQWDKLMGHASRLVKQGHWRQAIPLLGSSFEISECLLSTHEQHIQNEDTNRLCYADRYVIAGHQLAACYRQKGARALELHVLLNVHRSLLKLAKCLHTQQWALKSNIRESLYRIQRYCDFYGTFKGYTDLYAETQETLRQFHH